MPLSFLKFTSGQELQGTYAQKILSVAIVKYLAWNNCKYNQVHVKMCEQITDFDYI